MMRSRLPALACAAALVAAACDDRNRPGVGPPAPDSASAIVYGVIERAGTGPAPARVRADVTEQGCGDRIIGRMPLKLTDASGAYRIELVVESEPFVGCVLLDVDYELATLLPDTTVRTPGVRFRRFLAPRDSVRVDVTMAQP